MLCRSSKDNVPGQIFSLVYTLAAWWAQACKDMTDFRPSTKQTGLILENKGMHVVKPKKGNKVE